MSRIRFISYKSYKYDGNTYTIVKKYLSTPEIKIFWPAGSGYEEWAALNPRILPILGQTCLMGA
jgi:hypothetical protein